MRRLLTGYAMMYNRRHNRCGHVFQNRYKSILCQQVHAPKGISSTGGVLVCAPMSALPATPVAAEVRPPPPAGYRWLVLGACSLAMFGCYYTFDALYPVAPLLEKAFGVTGEQLGLLDTSYNVAALLTLIAGGVLIDRIGMAASAILFAAVGAVGTLLIAVLPALFPATPWAGMMAGALPARHRLGALHRGLDHGGGALVQGEGDLLRLAIQLLVARGGSWLADQSPDLFKPLFASWQPPLLLAAALGVAWLVFAVVYAVLERTAASRYAVAGAGATDKLVLKDLVRFDLGYWWVVGLCVAFYASIFPFRTFANLFFIDAHGVTPERAGELKSLLPLFSMIGMPIFGLVVDRVGRRALFMLVGSALLVPPFLLMAYTTRFAARALHGGCWGWPSRWCRRCSGRRSPTWCPSSGSARPTRS